VTAHFVLSRRIAATHMTVTKTPLSSRGAPSTDSWPPPGNSLTVTGQVHCQSLGRTMRPLSAVRCVSGAVQPGSSRSNTGALRFARIDERSDSTTLIGLADSALQFGKSLEFMVD
jgi:hypothetical protein